MSALGQKQTFERASVMSALPPIADISSVMYRPHRPHRPHTMEALTGTMR